MRPSSSPCFCLFGLGGSVGLFSLLGLLTSLSIVFTLPSSAAASGASQSTKAKSLTIFAAGDIADCRKISAHRSTASTTAAIIERESKKASDWYVITLGDTTYPIGAAAEFRECYEPTWGKFKASTLPTPGNHEYGVPHAQGYFDYFGEAAGTAQSSYYKKQIGSWLFLSLNSNLRGSEMQAQVKWLADALKHHKTTCTLAFWHHPRYSSGGHGSNEFMQEIWEQLAQSKVDIALSAHDHYYERLSPMNAHGQIDRLQGLRSFVVGTGGAPLTPMFFPKFITEVRQNDFHGILKLRLFSASYEWEFLPTEGSNFTDRGQATCHSIN